MDRVSFGCDGNVLKLTAVTESHISENRLKPLSCLNEWIVCDANWGQTVDKLNNAKTWAPVGKRELCQDFEEDQSIAKYSYY